MRPKLVLGMIGPCLFAAGCRLASDITDNLVFNTCLLADECQAKIYYRHLAAKAWVDFQAADPGHAYSADFANGFKEGFADYLDAGEDCWQRPLPPLKYWKTRYQNPEGRLAIELWFTGFGTGAAEAKASGYRDFVIIPVANGVPPPPDSAAPGPVGSAPEAPVPAPELPSTAPPAVIGRPVVMPAPSEEAYRPPPSGHPAKDCPCVWAPDKARQGGLGEGCSPAASLKASR
jgi:hypothetical protein